MCAYTLNYYTIGDFKNYRNTHLHVITLYHGWFPGSFFRTKSKASLTPTQIHQFR